jgi:thiol:disulfide interchange protein DsbD
MTPSPARSIRPTRLLLTLVLLIGAVRPAWAQLGAASATATGPVTVETVWSAPYARPGDQRVLAVVLQIQDRFHINPAAAAIPADLSFLIPTTVKATSSSPSLRFGDTQFPAPGEVAVRYTEKVTQLKAYEGRVVLYVPVVVDRSAEAGQAAVDIAVRYQACDETTCMPPRTVEMRATLRIVPREADAGESMSDPALFGDFDPSVFAALLAGETASAETPVQEPSSSATDASSSLPFNAFGWSFSLDVTTGWGLAALFAVTALGGLLLNFTPCVLPIIPIKIMSLAHAAGSRGRCFRLGLAMFLGVIAFWLGLGGAIAASLAAIGGGGITSTNQLFHYPAFPIAVGAIMAVMAAGMCGLFAVRLPRFIYAISPQSETYWGSFGLGIMTAVLSTPCTAPFMGSAAAWAVTQSATVALLTFAAIGFGMALPYLLLSAFPHWARNMPRTGPASELIKQVMGLLMFAAAAFFLGIGIVALSADGTRAVSSVYWWAVGAFVAAAGFWLAYRTIKITSSPVRRVVFTAFGLALLTSGAYLGLAFGGTGGLRATREAGLTREETLWSYYTPQRLEQALSDGRVVVLDFTADWCLNCKALERTVLSDPRVVALLGEQDIAAMKVDLTGNNPAGNALLQRVGRVAIPVLVVLDRTGGMVFNRDYYYAEQVLDAVAAARAAGPAMVGQGDSTTAGK